MRGHEKYPERCFKKREANHAQCCRKATGGPEEPFRGIRGGARFQRLRSEGKPSAVLTGNAVISVLRAVRGSCLVEVASSPLVLPKQGRGFLCVSLPQGLSALCLLCSLRPQSCSVSSPSHGLLGCRGAWRSFCSSQSSGTWPAPGCTLCGPPPGSDAGALRAQAPHTQHVSLLCPRHLLVFSRPLDEIAADAQSCRRPHIFSPGRGPSRESDLPTALLRGSGRKPQFLAPV